MFGLSYAPIMKALSKLLELPENAIAKEARKLLGDGLKGMSEGWHEITSVSRVLVRELLGVISNHIYIVVNLPIIRFLGVNL